MHISMELTQHRRRRLTLGIVVSVLVHAALLFIYRLDSIRAPEPSEPAPVSLFVLLKPQPKPIPEPVVSIPVRNKPSKSITQPSAPVQSKIEQESQEPPKAVVAVDRSDAPDPFYVTPSRDKPFDVEAARAAARQIATSPDPARADLPVAQFDKQRNRIATETRLAREISKAERPDCKDGIPGPFGGILSPLNLLTDKKDHGCKW